MPRVWYIPVHDSTRVRDVRVAAESAAGAAGLGERRTAAGALVATELATNLLKHAQGGQVLIEVVSPPAFRDGRDDARVVQIAALDHGPGIPDVPAALRDGFTTTGSLGAGLGTCRRLADDFHLHSAPGRGTVAVARVSGEPRPGGRSRTGGIPRGGTQGPGAPGGVESGDGVGAEHVAGHGPRRDEVSWGSGPRAVGASAHGTSVAGVRGGRRDHGGTADEAAGGRPRTDGAMGGDPQGGGRRADASSFPGVRAGGVNVPYAGAEYSGDAWAWVRSGDRLTLMLADGLGHGVEAARASAAAVESMHRSAHLPPAEALRRLHGALAGTRGAAVAVAQLDTRAGRLRFAGIGNVGARLRQDGTWRPLLSRPGIVGVHRPATVREEDVAWADDRLLILHTDGLPSRWTPPSDPGLPAADPAVTAAVTIRDASSSARPVRDDTAVAVLTPTSPDRP